MKIIYTFDSASLCESALITHAGGSEQRLRRAYPTAEIIVQHSAGAVYSIQCDDIKTQLAVDAILRSTARYTFDYGPLLQMMCQLHNYNKPQQQ